MKWEYYYLSNSEWLKRIAAKLGHDVQQAFPRNTEGSALHQHEDAIRDILNELGEDGWELASSTPVLSILVGSGGTGGAELIFKRPKNGC